MTKLDMSQFKPIPGFNSLKWKREVQTQIYEETKHMSLEERREYSRKSSEQLRKEREQYWTERAKSGDN